MSKHGFVGSTLEQISPCSKWKLAEGAKKTRKNSMAVLAFRSFVRADTSLIYEPSKTLTQPGRAAFLFHAPLAFTIQFRGAKTLE